MHTQQLKLIDLETPREAAERRHREYVARVREQTAEGRRKALEVRKTQKLNRKTKENA